MASNSRLYRNFIILQEDERGYASTDDKSLSGYSKIEAKGDNCKISFYAQNLRKDDGKYSMMLICCKKDDKKIVDLGKLNISDSGKGDCTKEYNVDNIGGLDISVDKISGAAIGKYKDGMPIFVMCGFLNGEQPCENWKHLNVIKAKEGKEVVKKEEKKMQYKQEKKHDKDESYKEEKKHDKNDLQLENNEDNNMFDKESNITEVNAINETNVINETNIVNDNVINAGISKENLRGKFEEYEEFIEENKEFDPNNCKIRGSVGEYFEAIVEGFERVQDQFKEIKYCKWYKVPVNDLYEMCNMSNYNKYTLAYYPMLNYYPYIKKYGYFMLGYKCDSKGNLKYIVYGIPGKKDKNEQPYDGRTGFVTWVNGNEKDNIGCWLMFYDYKNSTVVVPMQ